jgi:PBP1b-binding outer membrane lipoprotein LpoB
MKKLIALIITAMLLAGCAGYNSLIDTVLNPTPAEEMPEYGGGKR